LARREFCIEGCGVRRCAVVNAGQNGDEFGHVARCLAEITPEEVLQKVGQVIDG
jgi:hypothetical protein